MFCTECKKSGNEVIFTDEIGITALHSNSLIFQYAVLLLD